MEIVLPGQQKIKETIMNYVTFNLSGKKRTGILTRINNLTAVVKPITFNNGRVYRTENHFEDHVKVDIVKNRVRVYPEHIRPVN